MTVERPIIADSVRTFDECHPEQSDIEHQLQHLAERMADTLDRKTWASVIVNGLVRPLAYRYPRNFPIDSMWTFLNKLVAEADRAVSKIATEIFSKNPPAIF